MAGVHDSGSRVRPACLQSGTERSPTKKPPPITGEAAFWWGLAYQAVLLVEALSHYVRGLLDVVNKLAPGLD